MPPRCSCVLSCPPTPLLRQSASLLSKQLMQYQQQTQGQVQPRSRTPFGSEAAQGTEQSSSPTPHQQLADSQYGMSGAGRLSGERWGSGRGGGGMPGGLDDAGSETANSSWAGSNSTRALRRRGSSGSSEFYFVDQPQQQGGAAGSYAQPSQVKSPRVQLGVIDVCD